MISKNINNKQTTQAKSWNPRSSPFGEQFSYDETLLQRSCGSTATAAEDATVPTASLDKSTSKKNKANCLTIYKRKGSGGTRAFLSWGFFYHFIFISLCLCPAVVHLCPEASAPEYWGNQDEAQPQSKSRCTSMTENSNAYLRLLTSLPGF